VIKPDPQASDAFRHPLPANLIHDLRTPLSQIIGYAEMLTEQAQEMGNEGFVRELPKIRAAGYRLLTLINDNFHPVRAVVAQGAAAATVGAHSTPTHNGSAAEAFPETGAADKAASATAQGYLLVVDDIEANRDVLSSRLENNGYAVACAEHGEQALELLHANAFDMVLLDIMMPGMDGFQVLQRMKDHERLKHIPVIMISALNELDSVARAIQMGAEDYLPKPFNPILLRARVSACLEKKHARDREMLLFEQLQENYELLQELEKSRDDLMNMIVHDMRTPLTALIAGMATLEVMGSLNNDQREIMEIATAGGDTLLAMINDLLDVEKLESGSLQLEYTLVSAGNLVASAVAQVAPLAASKQLTLVSHIGADFPQFAGDENKLRRTVVNLLGNAIKFTPSGGTVTVDARCSVAEQSIVFSVSDTGEGIPAESLDRIFEKFGQVESRKGGRLMSTGLGLTFCRLAVEAHGGEIGVESAPGVGSKFHFTVPLSKRDAHPLTRYDDQR
jgi:two-component system sensor histidine kinase/response regulator